MDNHQRATVNKLRFLIAILAICASIFLILGFALGYNIGADIWGGEQKASKSGTSSDQVATYSIKAH